MGWLANTQQELQQTTFKDYQATLVAVGHGPAMKLYTRTTSPVLRAMQMGEKWCP